MKSTVSTLAIYLVILVVLASGAAWMKLTYLGVTPSSDSIEYVNTSRALCGDHDAHATAKRLLKPLGLLLICALQTTGLDYEEALLFQSLVLYLVFPITMFCLAREFLEDDHLAFLVALMATLSYPMMKYGVDIYTEPGAMIFVVLALIASLRFARDPSYKLFAISALLVSVGFLWKEYSVVAGLTLASITLFHRDISISDKISYSIFGIVLFAAIHVPLQFIVEMQYHYSYLTSYIAAAPNGFKGEFTLKNVIKSTAGVIGLAWLLVPFGLSRWRLISSKNRYFVLNASIPPFIGFIWGYISSRLLFVFAPPALLLGAEGLKMLSRTWQYVFVAVTIACNIAWLFLSYRITL